MLSIKCPYKQARGDSSKQPKFHQVTEIKKKKNSGKKQAQSGWQFSSGLRHNDFFYTVQTVYSIPNTQHRKCIQKSLSVSFIKCFPHGDKKVPSKSRNTGILMGIFGRHT